MASQPVSKDRQPTLGKPATAVLVVRPTSRIDFKTAAQQVIAAKKSRHTREAYTRDLDGWLAYCALEQIDPKSPTLSDATRYRDALVGSEDTRRRRLASMSTIYSTLRKLPDEHGRPIVAGNPFHPEILAWPKAGKVLKSRRIDDDTAFAIVKAATERPRDHAVLRLLLDTGWRRSAIASLPRANYDGRRVFNRQKGDKEQEVELPDESIAAIDRWLRERRTSDYLFPADDSDGHLHPNTVNKIIDRWAKKIAPEAHPHSFRALFLRDAHDAGLPSYEIQGAAGHASSDMTSRYDGKARGTGVARQVAVFRERRRGVGQGAR
jgi:integrase/recombinase XerD